MVTKAEIEETIKDKDDFIKIDYLNRFLKQADNLETKKFIFLHLAAVQENRNMLREAAKNVSNAGEIAINYHEKKDLFMKETEIWIEYGDFEMADRALLKALNYSTEQEKMEMRIRYLDLYKAYGKYHEDQRKTRKAIDIYKKLFSLRQSSKRKIEVKDKLLQLYYKTGRTREYEMLKHMNIKPDLEL